MNNMKQKTKYLTVRIRYIDEIEFIRGFEEIRKQIMSGKTNHDTGSIGDVSFDWHYLFEDYAGFQEKEIDGVLCKVYQSKMNKNE